MSERQEDIRARQYEQALRNRQQQWAGQDPALIERWADGVPAGFGGKSFTTYSPSSDPDYPDEVGTNIAQSWAPGQVMTPEQVQEVIANLRGDAPNTRGVVGGQGMTLESYIADPRSAIKLENGQYVFRPGMGGDFEGINPTGFWNNADLVSLLPLAAFAAGPFAASVGAGGAAGAAAGADAAGAAGGASGLSQAQLAALVESGTGGVAGAGLEAAAGIGAGGGAGAGGFLEAVKNLTSSLPSLDKLSTGSKLADSVIASGITGALSGGGGGDDSLQQLAEQQRADQAAQEAKINSGTGRIDSAFAGFNDDYYSQIADAYKNHYGRLIGEQADAAKRKVQLNWPGGPGTSGYSRRMGELTRDVERQYSDTASQAVDFSNQQRQQVESNRSGLVSQLNAGANADSLASQATSQAAALTKPPAYSPVGDLFSRYTSIPANMVLARNSGYAPRYGGSSSATRFGGKSPISVVS